jgi:4-hydroxyacetophenone monooxygenase
MAKRPELLEASDATIEDAVRYANPMVLRGLLHQLTGDESLASVSVGFFAAGFLELSAVTDPADVALIRSKAADFLKAYRDSGAGDIPSGPPERLQRSLTLTAGTEVPAADLDMWLEELALDPWARALEWTEPPSPEAVERFSVVVIGAGMGGLNAAVQLKHAGIPFTVLEKNAGVGGTWYENRYPGARVDSPSRTYTHIYGVDFPYPNPFCPQSENEKYFNWVADHFDVRRDIEFHTEVTSVIWDDAEKVWEVTARQPEGTRVWRANAVISAVGFLARPNLPDIPGLDEFDGPAFHTARWPSDLDLTGRRVAVIGSGCTGYQLVPEVVGDAAHTYVFQRTPSWCFDAKGYLDPFPPQINWLDRNLPYHTNFVRFQTCWMRRPDSAIAAQTVDPDFDDPHAVSPLNQQIRDKRIAFMQSKFADRPDLMEKMTPVAPPLSSRPVLVDRNYSIYDTLLRDDVTLVTTGIRRVTPTGIELEDGTHVDLDVIVLATGFKANDYLWPMEVRGRDGSRMEDLWAPDGPRAYLGAMLPGFPNLFMLYGPNTNGSGGLQIVAIEEMVTRFALGCIGGLITQGKRSVDASMDGYWRYNRELDKAEALKVYVDPRAHNYYQNEHGRSATQGPLDTRLLWHWLRSPAGPPHDNQLAPIEEHLVESRDALQPWFGHDLIVE